MQVHLCRSVLVLSTAMLLIGCSSESEASGSSASGSDYGRYLSEVATLDGDVITEDDATTRALLLCTGDPETMLGGVSIENFPTDLALIRAYCPDKEDSHK